MWYGYTGRYISISRLYESRLYMYIILRFYHVHTTVCLHACLPDIYHYVSLTSRFESCEKEKKILARSDLSLSVFDQREFDVMFLLAGLVAGQIAKIHGKNRDSSIFFYHSTLLNTWYLVCRYR